MQNECVKYLIFSKWIQNECDSERKKFKSKGEFFRSKILLKYFLSSSIARIVSSVFQQNMLRINTTHCHCTRKEIQTKEKREENIRIYEDCKKRKEKADKILENSKGKEKGILDK